MNQINVYENQSKNIQANNFQNFVSPTKTVLDAVIQTDAFQSIDESCQTDNLERKEVQASVKQQGEPIATQTDVSPKSDFQVQANIPRENHSIAVQTIKQEAREIAMPNLPSSTAETPTKKRKLSSKSTPSSSRDQVTNTQAIVEPTVHKSSLVQSISNGSGDQMNEEQAALDDSILNSGVYEIYSRNENPKEAMEQIKKLKTCILFQEPSQPFPTKDLKPSFEKALDNLWKDKPKCGISKFAKIKKYIERKTTRYFISELDYETWRVLCDCYTKIVMFNPDGYEYWYVANFEKGPSVSKWYRGKSNKWIAARALAQLHVMGITKAIIKKLQFDHYLKQKSEKIPWFNFALDVVENDLKSIFPRTLSPSFAFDVKEIKTDTTIEVNACFNLTIHDGEEKVYRPSLPSGKSTRPMNSFPRTGLPKNEREKMEKEAKKVALMEFFKERFGFTEFNDLCVDELHRPMAL